MKGARLPTPTIDELKRFKHSKGDSRNFWFDGLSTYVVKALFPTRITPIQVNFSASVVGILMGLAFIPGTLWGRVLGVVLFFVYIILDAVDGQLARARNDITKKGEYLDKIGHYLVYPTAGMAIGYGSYQVTGSELMIWMGFLLGLSQTVSSASRDSFKAVYKDADRPKTEQIEYSRGGALKRLVFRLLRFETMLYFVLLMSLLDASVGWSFQGLNLESVCIGLYALSLLLLNLSKTYLFYKSERLYTR